MSLAPLYVYPEDTPPSPDGYDPPNSRAYSYIKELGNSEATPWIMTPRGVYKILVLVTRSAGNFTVSLSPDNYATVKLGSPGSIALASAATATKYELEPYTAIKVTGDATFSGTVYYRAVTL